MTVKSNASMPGLQPLIQSRILALREQRVLLNADLAQLYGVETRILVQAVKRNLMRFPDDFMFQLSVREFADLRSQTVISSAGHGGRRTAPYAFTEQGVAMLSSVLGSPRAIAVNIEIMRTFVRVCALAATHGDLAKRLNELEEKTDALRELMTPPDPPKRPIGFVIPQEKSGRAQGSGKRKGMNVACGTCREVPVASTRRRRRRRCKSMRTRIHAAGIRSNCPG